jgi:hypothetical protein
MSVLTAELRPHPLSPCKAVRRIGIDIALTPGPAQLQLRFRVEGDVDRLVLPGAGLARRGDGLWQHTCFEAFLRPDASESYHEFNFAPSGDWAAYRFGGRRSDRSLPSMTALPIHFSAERERCDLTADIPIASLPDLAGAAALNAGVAAVVETDDGYLSYWALSHGGERPDFHDPSTFSLRVTVP